MAFGEACWAAIEGSGGSGGIWAPWASTLTPCDERGGWCAGTSYLTINYLKLNDATRTQRDGTRRDYYETRSDEDDDPTWWRQDERDDKTEWCCDDERQDGKRRRNNQTNKADVARCTRGHDAMTRLDKTRWGETRQGKDWENNHSISLIYFRFVFSQVS